uniref:non-specific protein-tyrosine kinase n=1 Tax=Podarcis muralis TaxID=64176 RepID=A0A670KD11_PODMU
MPPVKEEETPLISNRSSNLSFSKTDGLQVYLYHQLNAAQSASDSAGTLNFPLGEYTAEELCIAAAKACGILPVCHSLFALAREDLSGWYAPSHVFTMDEFFSQVLLYRIRFFFPNWFGSQKSFRCGLASDQVSPVLDYPTIDYLFAQVTGRRYPLSMENQETCLGLAVLDMLAQLPTQLLQPFLEHLLRSAHAQLPLSSFRCSYKLCLPEQMRLQLQAQNFVTRKRIRRQFGQSLHKVSSLQTEVRFLKLKYLMELKGLLGATTEETFQAWVPAQAATGSAWTIHVSSEKGILTSHSGGTHLFCDFPEIADITIKKPVRDGQPAKSRLVSVTKTDSRVLEMEFGSLADALSFVSLVDGYFRLTVDAQHYFCREVAPKRLLEDLENQCHGPITSEFAQNRLKASQNEGVAHVLRRSPEDFDSYLLTICIKVGAPLDFKSLLIQKGSDGTFSTAGVAKKFCSLREMLGVCQRFSLQADGAAIQLGPQRPPQPKGRPHRSHPWGSCPLPSCHGVPQSGSRLLSSPQPFLEAASMLGQLSHKHLVLLHGVCVGEESVMVQEYVRCGALDSYLRRNQASGKVTATWKLHVARQLAYALNFLEDKAMVHGNVSAKKVLLAREGDAASGCLPFIKLSDPGVSAAVLPKDLLIDRIPWVAPECLEDPKNLAPESDKWGFGATLWEIFNGGIMPLRLMEPERKLKFYQDRQQLPALKWAELANLVAPCLDFDPRRRPAFRSILRDLNEIITSDYELLSDLPTSNTPGGYLDVSLWQDPTLFEERHLKYISVLGKGNFGSVELCRYDPLGDSTGELVAVKRLQQSTSEHRADFEREIAILRSLHHDFVVAYRGVCCNRGRNSLRLVMEYLPNGCLRNYLQKNRERLDLRKLLLYAWQVCKGMDYLGSQRYIHRDLATRNILVENENHVKIGDFGLAKILPQDKEYYVVREPGQSPIFWYAPESLSDNVFSQESDVWSFGVVLYELFTYGSKSCSPSEEFLRMLGHSKPPMIVCQLLELLKQSQRLPSPPNCPAEVSPQAEGNGSVLVPEV